MALKRAAATGIALLAIAILAVALIGGGSDDDGGASPSHDLHTIKLGGPSADAPAATRRPAPARPSPFCAGRAGAASWS